MLHHNRFGSNTQIDTLDTGGYVTAKQAPRVAFAVDAGWPPAPATTAASWRPSANAPKLTSPDSASPNQRASVPHEPRTNRRRTRNADGTLDVSRRRVRDEQ
jgi:hypothetical protein